ncbi:hypothetical protein [Tychonema sp. LEGE 07203]|nr:hypothetical protein [Tychonema sp. LEGE 07203]
MIRWINRVAGTTGEIRTVKNPRAIAPGTVKLAHSYPAFWAIPI